MFPNAVARKSPAVAYALTVALALTLPFEPVRPLFSSPWLQVNHLKLLVGATALAWAATLISRPCRVRAWRSRLGVVGPAIALVVVAILSALFAPGDRAEALKFVGRIASGLFALALAIQVATTAGRLHTLLWAVIVGAGVSACIGLGEAAGWRLMDPLLAVFKVAPTRVGGDLRVSATFQYATIAAMFFELATPIALAAAATARTWLARAVAIGIAVVCTAVVVLTLTRAGIGALAVVLVLLLGLAWARRAYRALALPTTAAALTLVAVMLGLAVTVPSFDTRLTTENDVGWYVATYDAPASLNVAGDSTADVQITARNLGSVTWTTDGEHPFGLGYRWLSADGAFEMDVPHAEERLPHNVPAGEAVQFVLHVQAPLPPGDYRVAWGMLQHGIVWFHSRGSPDAETSVNVAPQVSPTAATPGLVERDDSATRLVVSRQHLWAAALQMIVQRPLLGVGPDNFRHLYGAYLGMSVWDDRVHANNLYLEVLADLGVLGAVALLALVAPAVAVVVRSLRAPTGAPRSVWGVGMGGSLLAFFLHGALDYFLEFTAIYVLFWLLIGLLLTTSKPQSSA